MNGDFFPLKQAFSEYMARFYAGLYPDTSAMQEYTARGVSRGIVWAPDRMVDAAEDMLASYRKNENGPAGASSLFPIIIVAMSKDYIPTGGDWGGKQVGRQLVSIVEGGSVYGYRQGMGDIRVQAVIISAESATARSLAAQFSLFVGEIPNRRFSCKHQFGQYEFQMPCMLESPDILFSEVKTDQPNITVLAADLTLKAVFPYFDAPKPGQPNDGTANNPPGYPLVAQVDAFDFVVNTHSSTDADGVEWSDAVPTKPPA